ncbi:MAG TPA: molybdopterin-dependent oxidoreductase, partial [Candidatus Acidoferrum sp.]|nr:molybdopterin-dependent oxidoreductase [Candidatus Acidoferrum sp.]
MRGANSVIIPNREDHLECEECGMCIDICPVGALTSGTYRYKTRPWEMEYVPTTCAHCSNGCKTTLSVRNHEIMRANNRDMSGINGDFLCIKGRFGFDFTKHPDRIKQPMVRKGDKLFPVSWEEAAQAAAAKLKEIQAKNGGDAIGFIGSNRTSNEENYLFQRLARETFGSSNIDHHRTADYSGLMTALGENAKDSLLTMEQLYKSKAVLLIGNDPTNQNPLVAWQIRAGVRHHGLKLFVINSKAIKLTRKAAHFVQIAEGQEAAAVRWLHNESQLGPTLVEQLTQLKAQLDSASDVAIVFGSELSGAALNDLIGFGSKLQGKVRYMALGDYANSRGAADMGVLPDHGPGYSRAAKSGMTAPQMVESAQSGKLKALYVVGANPLAHYGTLGYGRGKAELLIVHELFMTETAKQADIIFPATSAYEKDGTVTNTSGEVQRLQKAAEVMGPRSDFDLLRILSHQLEKLGLGKAFHYKNPAAVFEEIRKSVPGYNVELNALLAGEAEDVHTPVRRNGGPAYDVPVGLIRSAGDTLFTSGTLSKFLTTIESVPEAQAKS